MPIHPSKVIDQSAMSARQLLAVFICIALNALDGFDVLAISFASPGIAAEWQIDRAELGVVLAMELIGMAIGSILLGGIADRIGRKPTIQACLVLMTLGMLGAAYVDTVNHLLIVRFFTGLGIGGMLAATNAMVAEFSNLKYRHLCVILMATGYPIGAILGGSVASELLQTQSWRSVFMLGGVATGGFLFIVAVLLPESAQFLANRQPVNALARLNATLKTIGKPVLDVLPVLEKTQQQAGFKTLFSPRLRMLTVLLVVAYFTQIMTFYYILKWIPKIVVDMGFHPSEAGHVLVWANIGGATGAFLLGLFASRLPLKPLLIGMLIVGFFMVGLFGRGYDNLTDLALISAATGFFTNSGVVGLYALMAQTFPPEVRGSGTGIVIGVGRGGAALSPIVAGIMFAGGVSLQGVSIAMGAGALVAALAVFVMHRGSKANAVNPGTHQQQVES